MTAINHSREHLGGHPRDDLQLDVRYEEGVPKEIQYSHPTFGMMKFLVSGSTAVPDSNWTTLSSRGVKDRFDRWITAGDVHRSVLRLPFIESIDCSLEVLD